MYVLLHLFNNSLELLRKVASITACLFFRIEDKVISDECAVKVFKTTLTDFKTRERYIREDYRFRDRMTKNNTQKVGFVVNANIVCHSLQGIC